MSQGQKSDKSPNDIALEQPPIDLWLEEVEGESAMAWVRDRNSETMHRLSGLREFSEVRNELRGILEARDRLPSIHAVWWDASQTQSWVLNVWQDAQHPQGVLRATTWSEFTEVAEPNWQIWLDVDALASREGVSWVLHDVRPAPRPSSRALLSLSRGGGDAVEWREYDLQKREFVESGFRTSEAKAIIAWCDAEHLYAAWPADANEKTAAGYPRRMRLWGRDESLIDAPIVLEAPREDVLMWAYVMREFDQETLVRSEHFLHRFVSFHESKLLWRSPSGELREVPLPAWVDFVDVRSGQFVMYVKRSTIFAGTPLQMGEVWSWDWEHWKATGEIRGLTPLWKPSSQEAYLVCYETRDALILLYLRDVQTQMDMCRWIDGRWQRTSLWGDLGEAHVVVDFTSRDRAQIVVTRHHELEPPSQYLLDLEALWAETLSSYPENRRPENRRFEVKWRKLRQSPPRFRSEGLVCERYFATSADGEKIPYRIVRNQRSGPAPTLITAYGGFESPVLPRYWSDVGKVWLERGGAYIVANIRGGSEYGPRWHQAALRENRQRAYDDLFAVTEDAIRRGLSSAGQIGFRGGSNGGLLAGNAMVQRPDLYQAVIVQVPLLDMLRFHRLLAGAAWVSEYGSPENEADRVWLRRYSPYHQVRADQQLPEAFVTTSTRDDRVHPGHARRFTQRLRELGHRVLYFENIEGGHAGAATPASKSELLALEYVYLLRALKVVSK